MKQLVKAVGGMHRSVIYTNSGRENGDWMSEGECIKYAQNAQVELEVCFSDLGTEFLRAYPSSLFQKKLGSLLKK